MKPRIPSSAALSALFLLLLPPSTSRAQRCVDPGDSADQPGSNRFCGTDLVSGLGGPEGWGDHTTASGGCLSQNDDGSSPEIDIRPYFPSGLNFFGTVHESLYVNTNGNITFGDRLSTYTPDAFPVADRPMIAPFWGDVDIRMADGSCNEPGATTCTSCTPCYVTDDNQVWWHLEEGRAVFTWDEVGYYGCNADRRMSFQLILSSVATCGGAGDFDVEFRFNRCEWETGDASDGSGGFGGTPAQSGFDAGDGTNFVEIMGSRMAGISRKLCEESNVGEPGVWRFQIRSGVIMCPEAGMECDTGEVGVCGAGRISCDCSGDTCTTSCVPQVSAGPERCNALDDDCDGSVDEGEDAELCVSSLDVCDRGVCVPRCFEGGCADGFSCNADGLCEEPACVDVTCPDGQRCVGGTCVGACEGVVCPAGLACRGGRCVDACAGITCDECTVCEDGSCITRCDLGGACAADEACTAEGRCVPAACDGVSCPAGQFCEDGACVDACRDAVCPAGQMCRDGECVQVERPDAGLPAPRDAGGPPPPPDAAIYAPPMDGGAVDGGVDAGRAPSSPDPTCGCRLAGGPDRPTPAWLLLALLGLVVVRRRR